ncbi:hypothetical protein WISP_118465 [Willisornis vidua]|uniref:Uncharacterized protein n=1 Tax=Willisornis vidua TaxID=1566151 RepID=A0ABQ9CT49_9PASS|nr:hypothetical protein WISP_118465 [Willisornis vidua]
MPASPRMDLPLAKAEAIGSSGNALGYIATKIKDVSAIWKELQQIELIHQIQYILSQLALTQVSAQGTRQQEISALEVQDKYTYNRSSLAFLGNNGPFQVISEISQVKGTGQSFDPIHKEPVSILKSEDRVYHGSTGKTGDLGGYLNTETH